jgi:carboxypeptidase T
LIVSNHHSRELITPELALDSAKKLVNGYLSNDETIKTVLKSNQVYIMYTMNPDGLNYVWSTNNWWRKNRRRNANGSYGVDLNRNYDAGWNSSKLV